MEEANYSGPSSAHQLIVSMTSEGNEVIISGHLHIQAHHKDGERVIVYSLIRDGLPLYKRVVRSQFTEGRLEEFISLSHIDLPDPGYHVYEVDLFIVNEQPGPVYTGMPHFDKHIRVREL